MKDNSDWKIKTKRYVAFMDVLGFKDYVLRHGINEVYERLQTLNGFRPEEGERDYDSDEEKRIKVSIFSDSIFIFSRDDEFVTLRHFLSYVNRISGSKVNNLKEDVKNQRFYSSGDARKYVDNTLTMLESFE